MQINKFFILKVKKNRLYLKIFAVFTVKLVDGQVNQTKIFFFLNLLFHLYNMSEKKNALIFKKFLILFVLI